MSQITPPSHPRTCQWVYGWCGSSLVVQSLLQKPRIKLTQFVNARVSSIQPVTRAKVVLRGTNAHVRIVSACLQQTHPWDTSNTFLARTGKLTVLLWTIIVKTIAKNIVTGTTADNCYNEFDINYILFIFQRHAETWLCFRKERFVNINNLSIIICLWMLVFCIFADRFWKLRYWRANLFRV